MQPIDDRVAHKQILCRRQIIGCRTMRFAAPQLAGNDGETINLKRGIAIEGLTMRCEHLRSNGRGVALRRRTRSIGIVADRVGGCSRCIHDNCRKRLPEQTDAGVVIWMRMCDQDRTYWFTDCTYSRYRLRRLNEVTLNINDDY